LTPKTSQSDREQAEKTIIAAIEAKALANAELIGHGNPPDAFHDLLRAEASRDVGLRVLTFLARS